MPQVWDEGVQDWEKLEKAVGAKKAKIIVITIVTINHL